MKIRLVKDALVDAKHGLFKGTVFEVVRDRGFRGAGRVQWEVVTQVGEQVGVLAMEAEVVSETKEVPVAA